MTRHNDKPTSRVLAALLRTERASSRLKSTPFEQSLFAIFCETVTDVVFHDHKSTNLSFYLRLNRFDRAAITTSQQQRRSVQVMVEDSSTLDSDDDSLRLSRCRPIFSVSCCISIASLRFDRRRMLIYIVKFHPLEKMLVSGGKMHDISICVKL